MTLRILPAGAIAAGVHRTFTDETLEDLVENDDGSEPGLAEFHFELDYDHANGRLTRVDLSVRLTIDMAEWRNVSRRPRAEQDEWNRFLRALRAHEDGHIDIFRREGSRTYEKLLLSRPGRIRRVLAAEEARIRRLSDSYDVQTDHGRTQQTPHGTTEIQVP